MAWGLCYLALTNYRKTWWDRQISFFLFVLTANSKWIQNLVKKTNVEMALIGPGDMHQFSTVQEQCFLVRVRCSNQCFGANNVCWQMTTKPHSIKSTLSSTFTDCLSGTNNIIWCNVSLGRVVTILSIRWMSRSCITCGHLQFSRITDVYPEITYSWHTLADVAREKPR